MSNKNNTDVDLTDLDDEGSKGVDSAKVPSIFAGFYLTWKLNPGTATRLKITEWNSSIPWKCDHFLYLVNGHSITNVKLSILHPSHRSLQNCRADQYTE